MEAPASFGPPGLRRPKAIFGLTVQNSPKQGSRTIAHQQLTSNELLLPQSLLRELMQQFTDGHSERQFEEVILQFVCLGHRHGRCSLGLKYSLQLRLGEYEVVSTDGTTEDLIRIRPIFAELRGKVATATSAPPNEQTAD